MLLVPKLVSFETAKSARDGIRDAPTWLPPLDRVGADLWTRVWDGGSPKAVRRVVTGLRAALRSHLSGLDAYRDKAVAHLDRQRPGAVPTWNNLFAAIEGVYDVFSHIFRVLFGCAFGKPSLIMPWEDLLEERGAPTIEEMEASTHERAAPSPKKIKIPNVCVGLGVKCMTPYEMLRWCGTRLRSKRQTV